jgi:hypothetical protein
MVRAATHRNRGDSIWAGCFMADYYSVYSMLHMNRLVVGRNQILTRRRRNSLIISTEPIAQQLSGIVIQIDAFV